MSDVLPYPLNWFAPWTWFSARTWRMIAVILAVYITPYLLLSRRGYFEADLYDGEGFYYFTPQNTDRWRLANRTCMYLFYPANQVDQALGFGRPAGCDPLFEIQ